MSYTTEYSQRISASLNVASGTELDSDIFSNAPIATEYAFITGMSFIMRIGSTAAVVGAGFYLWDGTEIATYIANQPLSTSIVLVNIGGINWRVPRNPTVSLRNAQNVFAALHGQIFFTIGD